MLVVPHGMGGTTRWLAGTAVVVLGGLLATGSVAATDDPLAAAKRHGLPRLPRLSPSAVTVATATDWLHRDMPEPLRQREVRTRTLVEGKPAREIVTVELVRGSDFLRRQREGPIERLDGRLDGRAWSQTLTGLVEQDAFGEDALVREDAVEVLGDTSAPVRTVVRALWKRGRSEVSFFDPATGDLLERTRWSGNWSGATTFEDYTTLDGARYAKTERLRLNGANAVAHVEAMVPRAVTPADIAPPPSRPLIDVTAPIAIPVTVASGELVTRIQINGRGYDFIIDTGSSRSGIDPDVADGLHLAGAPQAAVVPLMHLGPLELTNVTLERSRAALELEPGAKRVGVLGADFFASGVVKVDYETPAVTLMPYAGFDGAGTGGFAMPLRVHAGVPFTVLGVGEHESDRFLLDTGSSKVVVTQRFASKYPNDVRDLAGGNHYVRFTDIYSAYGSGLILTKLTQVSRIQFGPGVSNRSIIQLERDDEPPSAVGRMMDGVVGYNMLRLFDAWYDYARNVAWFKPNDALQRTKGTPKPAATPDEGEIK